MRQNKKNLVICRIGFYREWEYMAVCFVVSDRAEQWRRDPCWAQPGSVIPISCCRAVLWMPGWLLVTAVCSQHGAGMLPWDPLSALPHQCSFPPCWEAEVLRTSPQRHLHSLCFERNVHVSLHCGKHTGKSVFIQEWAYYWLDCLGVWVSDKSSHFAQISSQKPAYSESHIWQYVRPLNRSSNWDILALWCDALALKPGRGWDEVEPSQVQKLSFLERNLWHS